MTCVEDCIIAKWKGINKMLYVVNTPQNAGVSIYGDYWDLETLYDALHEITGEEGENISYEACRLRVLGVCYEIRHALMGDREIESFDNGIDQEKMKRMSVIMPEKNIYYKFNMLWPELLFVTMALNDFIMIYARKQTKGRSALELNSKNIWDKYISCVCLFQSSVALCIKETIAEKAAARTINLMNKDYCWLDNYITQYVDLLNYRFINMEPEKRFKNISIMAKRMAEKGDEYQQLKKEVADAAEKHHTVADNIRITLDFPEEIDW